LKGLILYVAPWATIIIKMKIKDKMDKYKHNYINLPKSKQKKVDSWIKRNGCAIFDFKNREIILYDGGLFSIEKEIKIKPKTRVIFGKLHQTNINGKIIKTRETKFIPIRKNGKVINEECEYYKANIWFEEIDETTNYFISMKRMLNRLGFKTNHKNEKDKYQT
jgi:hypothetical protein